MNSHLPFDMGVSAMLRALRSENNGFVSAEEAEREMKASKEDIAEFAEQKRKTDSHRWSKLRYSIQMNHELLDEFVRSCLDCGQEDTCLPDLPECPLEHTRKWLDTQHPEFSASRQLAKVLYDYALQYVRDRRLDEVVEQRNKELADRWQEIQTLRADKQQMADEHTNTIEAKVKLSLALQAALMWLDALEYEMGAGEKFVNAMPYKCPTRSTMRSLIKP